MGDIILAVMILILFAFGYLVTYRFGKFMEENLCAYKKPQAADRKVCITETEGKSPLTVSKEVGTMVDSLLNGDNYGIIICRTVDSRFIEGLKESGCSVEYDFRQ